MARNLSTITRGSVQIAPSMYSSRHNVVTLGCSNFTPLDRHCPFGGIEKFEPHLPELNNQKMKKSPDYIYILIDTSGSTCPTSGCGGGRYGGSGRFSGSSSGRFSASTSTQNINTQNITTEQESKTKCIILAETEMIAHILVLMANYYDFSDGVTLVITSFSSNLKICVNDTNVTPEKLYDIAKNLDKILEVEFGGTNTADAINSVKIYPEKNHLVILASDGRPDDETKTIDSSIKLLLDAVAHNSGLGFVTVGAGKILESDGTVSDIFNRNLPISQQTINNIVTKRNSTVDQIVTRNSGRTSGGWVTSNYNSSETCNIGFLTQLAQNSNNIGGAYIPAYRDYKEGIERFTEFITTCVPLWVIPNCPAYTPTINSQITLANNAQKNTIIAIENVGDYLIYFPENKKNVCVQIALEFLKEEPVNEEINEEINELLKLNVPVCMYSDILFFDDDIIVINENIKVVFPENKMKFYKVLKDSEGHIRRRYVYKY